MMKMKMILVENGFLFCFSALNVRVENGFTNGNEKKDNWPDKIVVFLVN